MNRFQKTRVWPGYMLCLLVIAALLIPYARVLALGEVQKQLIDSGARYSNVGDSCSAATPGGSSRLVPANSRIYIVGDSITHQSRDDIAVKFTDAGYVISDINSDPGRAITTDTAGTEPSGIDAVNADALTISESDAVIIALGTNSGTEDLNTAIPSMIQAVKAANQNIPIFWANLFYTDGSGPAERNATITSLEATQGYKVIDLTRANIELSTDLVHPTAIGSATFAQSLVSGIGAAPVGISAGGASNGSTVAEPIVGGDSTDGNSSHILSYLEGLDEAKAADAINIYIQQKKPESPFVGLGAAFVAGGKLYNVNPFLAVGHIEHENGFATAPSGWHTTTPPSYNAFGRSASASQPHTIYTTASGRERMVFRWSSWAASLDGNNGTEDPWFALINRKYLSATGDFKIASGDFATYMSHYAPNSDGNNEAEYVSYLKSTIDSIISIMGTGQQYTGSTGGSSGGCNGVSLEGRSGIVNPEGYAFPLAPQTRVVEGVAVNQAGTLHHDGTPAFDLTTPIVGANVYAIANGTVTGVVTNFKEQAGCSTIQLYADDGFYYWYGHLKNTTVDEGDRVSAGTKIAEIADDVNFTAACYGGTPHLHIDRGCVINGEPQTAGRRECRDPDFIPFLSALYAGLPN